MTQLIETNRSSLTPADLMIELESNDWYVEQTDTIYEQLGSFYRFHETDTPSLPWIYEADFWASTVEIEQSLKISYSQVFSEGEIEPAERQNCQFPTDMICVFDAKPTETNSHIYAAESSSAPAAGLLVRSIINSNS